MRKAAGAAAAAQAAEALYIGQERDFVERISALVRRQTQKLVDMAAPVTKVDPAML